MLNFSEKNRWVFDVFDSMSEAVFSADEKGVLFFMNSQAVSLSGWSKEESIGKSINDIVKFSTEDEIQTVFSSSVCAPEKIPREFTGNGILIKKDGTKNPVDGKLFPLFDVQKKQTGIAVLLKDATTERRLLQAKDHFLSIVAHQLRTPLGSARWCMDMLLSGDIGELSPSVRESIVNLHSSNQQMIELTNDLLDMAKLNKTKGVEDPIWVNAGNVVDNIFRFLILDAQRYRVVLEKKDEILGRNIFVPRRRFYEVMRNLVSNAIKYSKPGGHVLVKIIDSNGRCLLSVRDEGIGIPANEQQNIFSKFFRASNAVHSRTEGSGLGLATVKSFAEEWGGRVWFESVEDKGTTFFVELPFENDLR